MNKDLLKSSTLLAVAALSGSALWFAFSHAQTPNASPTPQLQALQPDERNTVEVVQRVSDSVVYLSVRSRPTDPVNLPGDLQPFAPLMSLQPQEGIGSGFVLDKQGRILTNNHVVQRADQITVKFRGDPKAYPAKMLAMSAYTPQALQANNLPPSGLMVQSVEKGSPAEKAGLKAPTRFLQVQAPDGSVQQIGLDGDVLVEAGGVTLSNINDLRGVLEGLKAGQATTLKLLRGGKAISLQITPTLIPG